LKNSISPTFFMAGSSAGDAQQLGRERLYHLIVENRRPVRPACIPLRAKITQAS
jgi:hypothetical protein